MQEVNADSTNSRELPESIVIPSIRGEMARLRQATIEDLARMDSLHAFDGAAVITGKDSQSDVGLASALSTLFTIACVIVIAIQMKVSSTVARRFQ